MGTDKMQERMKDRMFRDRQFIEKLVRLALPIALQAFMLAAVAAADAFMLGAVEQDMMSAVSLATQIQFIQNMCLSSIVGSTAILGAQYWGKGNMEAMDDIFSLSLRLCSLVSLLFYVGCVFFPEYLMRFYTDKEVLIKLGAQYLQIAGFSYLLTGFSQCYLTMMKVSEHVPSAVKISSMAVVLNIILNGVFIFGLAGIPKMGVKGAALATLIARTVEFTFCVAVSYRKSFIHPKLLKLFRRNQVLERDFFHCMWPLLGACLLWGVGFTSYSSFMGHLGTDAAGANSITAVVRDLICCVCDGLASGGGILVGNELGAGNLKLGKLYGQRLAKIAFLVGFASTILMIGVTPIVLATVKLTLSARHYLIQMMFVMAFYMIGRVVNTIVINGVFASGGDTLFDVYSLAVSMWCIAVPLAALGTYVWHFPVVAVYACTCLDEVGKIPWTMYHFKKYKWVKNLTKDIGDIGDEK